MAPWTSLAFVRYTVFFIAGILPGIYFPTILSVQTAGALFIACVVIFILLVIFFSGKAKYIAGPLGLTAITFAGFVNVRNGTAYENKDHFLYEGDSIKYYQAVITGYPEETATSWKAVAEVKYIQTSRADWKECTGKVLMHFSKEAFTESFQYGDILIIKGTPQPISPPGNPHEFNYKTFLSYKNIYCQQFARPAEIHFQSNHPPSFVIGLAHQIRFWAYSVLKKYLTAPSEFGVGLALVLGVTDDLDKDLLSAYAASGTMHVLAVSGLHVGIIYGILLLLLKPLKNSLRGRWLLAVISVFILWLYAFVTGLSPSVLRAVTMFSMIAMAEPWGKRTNVYNTLSVSAFCLLLYDPYLIMNVGFQLSYLAVMGIVFLYPLLYRLWLPSGWIGTKVWQMICVSLAAQIATFPLSLLYFHQFPVYFLFSNLIVMPLSFLVLILGLFILVVSPLEWLAQWVGYGLVWSIKGLNGTVLFTESLPFSLIENVYIDTFQCLLVFALVLCLVLLFTRKKLCYLGIAACFACIFSGIQWQHWIHNYEKRRFIVYKIPGYHCMDFIAGSNAYFLTDSALLKNPGRLDYHVKSNRLVHGVEHVSEGSVQPFIRNIGKGKIVLWNGYKLLIVGKDFNFARDFIADYLIVSHNTIRDIDTLKEKFHFRHLVIDSSNSFYVADKLFTQAKNKQVSVHSVLHQGAFEIVM